MTNQNIEAVKDNNGNNTSTATEIIKNETNTEIEIERCYLCNKNLNDPELKMFYGHPQNAVEEYIALTDENLVLASGILFFLYIPIN